jgi:acyl-coenzyme A thioesterase PaaI-like protein
MMKVSLSEQEDRRLEAKNCSFYVGNDVSEHADRFSLLVNSFNNIPFHRLLGLELVAVDSKQIIAAITKTEQLYNHRRWSHGGVIATCFDAVGGYKTIHEIYLSTENVKLATLKQRVARLVTKRMRLEYLSPPMGECYQIAGLTTSHRAGRFVNEITMIDNAGHRIAKAMATYVELPPSL